MIVPIRSKIGQICADLTSRPISDTIPPVPAQLRVLRLNPRACLPRRQSAGASGYDLTACLAAAVTLGRHPILVPTGLAFEAPAGYDVQMRPRSGLSLKGVGAAFGTIDADYRGEIFVTMWTFGDLDAYELHDGDRIAQIVISKLADVDLVEAVELTESSRAGRGHGSTGR